MKERLLLRPYSFYVKCFTVNSLFAGKMHALLFRKWKNRVKGRDWYDMEWYIREGIELDFNHFVQRAKDTGDWTKEAMTEEEFRLLLREKIQSTAIEKVKDDVIHFIKNDEALRIWSNPYFLDLAEKIKIKK